MHPTAPDHSHSPAEVGQERPQGAEKEHRGRTLIRSGALTWASVIVLGAIFLAVIVWFAGWY